MTARATVLADHEDGAELRRWFLAAAIVVAAHGALMAGYFLAPSPRPDGAALAPAVIIDLAPLPVAPPSHADLAPGPEMVEQQQQHRPPDPPQPAQPQLVEPLPKVETPAVVTLPLPAPKVSERQPQENPVEQEAKPPPEKPVEQPKVTPPEPVRAERRPPAPRSTASPRSQNRPAPVARAPSPGSAASSAATANWRDLVVARLQRAKRYPGGAGARREQGVVTLSFSVNRSGRVLGRRIVRSSGYSALDQEALATIERAQPLPPFPAAMTQSVIHLTVPIHFALR